MTNLTSVEVSKLTAIVTGGVFHRSATRTEAVNRFQRVCDEAKIASPLIFLEKPFDIASAELSVAVSTCKSQVAEAPQSQLSFEENEAEVVNFSAARSLIRSSAIDLAIATKPQPKKEAKEPKEPTKREVMLDMVCSPEGATEAEICERIGWKACATTLKRAAKAANVTLRLERQKGAKSRFFGTRP
ncbi:DUF3489 domain-containing protein [Brucella anthropi]|uniref:DUF3489 domain-containing protein n=1 Tax=Brucella anthropi (strain ATCC 49188 / DSM 6882 / CCUG 24695 / JCM 21032 / LMG 3331 / NBRC 15819 / NCTC 12168 / Alc 37) TaxID=439375 RepID=A6WZ21_BRUA4|nr:DUF3489 domain-containing protein [Brucella anthropi]ABS14225.1 hypothetical protein Oant_1509 [Brucella anthropi ATCC 49188]QQC25751.1 DUF3489 domain-containing protein [Brucella anthropi]SUA65549.1 Protein of uncharacterised function (DUF3489) [Brucella anthropi]